MYSMLFWPGDGVNEPILGIEVHGNKLVLSIGSRVSKIERVSTAVQEDRGRQPLRRRQLLDPRHDAAAGASRRSAADVCALAVARQP